MKKVLFVVPHLSTGGLPQYTFKLIESLKNNYDVYCLENNDVTGGILTVQRNRISKLLKNKFYSLTHDKLDIHSIISKINPDIIHFQEIPQTFISMEDLDKIYYPNRNYKIVVTTHSSNTNPKDIIYGADRFILVSNWSKNKFVSSFGEDLCQIWEYPIEKISYSKSDAKRELGFDTNYKHILNVGLFTSGKNQKELIEIARKMKNERVKFHFVGNQAINFKDYWEPIMQDFPDNCIWHGEREDVDKFYKASDMFYFTSNFELNPLVVKEAIGYGLPTFIKKLESYGNDYDNIVNYIHGDIGTQIKTIKSFLGLNGDPDTITIILAHANTIYRKKLLKECIEKISGEKLLSSNYIVDSEIQEMCDYVLYTKNNPLLFADDFKKYNLSYNYWWIDKEGVRHTKPFEYEHGYAVYTLIQNGLRYAKNLGKHKVHVVNYDYLIDEVTLKEHEEIIEKYDAVFYEHLDSAYEGPSYNGAFFSGNINSLESFFETFKTIDDYYFDGDGFNILERKLQKHYQKNNYNIFTQPIDVLKKNSIVDRECLLDISKSEKHENMITKKLRNEIDEKEYKFKHNL